MPPSFNLFPSKTIHGKSKMLLFTNKSGITLKNADFINIFKKLYKKKICLDLLYQFQILHKLVTYIDYSGGSMVAMLSNFSGPKLNLANDQRIHQSAFRQTCHTVCFGGETHQDICRVDAHEAGADLVASTDSRGNWVTVWAGQPLNVGPMVLGSGVQCDVTISLRRVE